MTMKNVFAGLMALVTLLSCEQKKDETLVLYSEADFAGLRVGCSAGSYYEQHLSPGKISTCLSLTRRPTVCRP